MNTPKTSKIVAPPYHVQSTANELRNEFPYFPYHDSVSKLWSDKWRKPCQHGIYPFTDAKVEDFDPIFDELVKISGDNSEILNRPDDYAKPFMPAAEKLMGKARNAEDDGDESQAMELYLRAAAVYRIARFPINRSKVTQEAWEKGREAYIKGGRYLSPPNHAIDIPFDHADTAAGDSDRPIQAFLRIPEGKKPDGGWPVLLFICGLDAYKTDHTNRTQAHTDHGFATLSFEIPGTGDCPAAPSDPNSPDRLMSSVLDWVAAKSTQYSFNADKIFARGVSTGGYYAMRVAHTHADRLTAVVAQGGAGHHMFDEAWINAQNQMEYPFNLADALAYKYGYRDDRPLKAYADGAHKFSLVTTGILERQSCKLLVLNGMEDSIFPMEDSLIVGTTGDKKDLILRANCGHMGNPGGEEIVYDWLDAENKSKPKTEHATVMFALTPIEFFM